MSEATRVQAEKMLFHVLELGALKRLFPNEGREYPFPILHWSYVVELVPAITHLYVRSGPQEREIVFATLINFLEYVRQNAGLLDSQGGLE